MISSSNAHFPQTNNSGSSLEARLPQTDGSLAFILPDILRSCTVGEQWMIFGVIVKSGFMESYGTFVTFMGGQNALHEQDMDFQLEQQAEDQLIY